jgi:hypothetical protein
MSNPSPPKQERRGKIRTAFAKRFNSDKQGTNTVADRKLRIWFCTGETFSDVLIGADAANYREVDQRPPIRQTKYIPVLEKRFAAFFSKDDPPPSAHQFIITVDPANEEEIELSMEVTLRDTGKTVTEVFKLSEDFQRVKDSSLRQLSMLFVFGFDEAIDEIDYGELCLVDVTDETAHGFVEKDVTFTCELLGLDKRPFRVVEVIPDIEITDALAEEG